MNIKKLKISKDKNDINLQFYFFLKYITKLKPSNPQTSKLLENLRLLKRNNLNTISEQLILTFTKNIKSKNKFSIKSELIKEVTLRFKTYSDIELFIFALNLYQIKDLLVQEAKFSENTYINKLENLDTLSLEYDRISNINPYMRRVNGALLVLQFFEKLKNGETNFISKDTNQSILNIDTEMIKFQERGLETNQIFLLIFSEIVNQSIISDSGSNYENRILSILNKNGILDIKKTHDRVDNSTEFDFFFEIDNRSYGISAKRTLRERYKQFIKTASTSEIDIMIQITLGIDLSEEKAKTITSHGTYIFVSNEIYEANKFLQNIEKIYSVKYLNLETLKGLR